MRTVHVRFLLLALGIGTFTAGALGGCGGDDSNGGTGDDGGSQSDTSVTGDGGGGGDDGGGGQDSGPTVHADANDVSVYLGQIAKLDGSASVPPGATLTWTVDSVPAGSGITTASLLNANGAKPSFTPDKVGDYALKLTVSSGGVNDVKTVTVHTVEAVVFYNDTQIQGVDGGPAYAVNVVNASGTGTHAVNCLDQSDGGGLLQEYSWLRATYGSADWWEPAAGQATRIAYAGITRNNNDGGLNSVLFAGTSASSCAAPPKLIDTAPATPSIFGHYSLRISPDGNRVAYVLFNTVTDLSVHTIGFDGTTTHNIGPYKAYPDGGPQADGGYGGLNNVAVRWMGAQVAWANNGLGSGNRFQITVAPDQDNAPQTAYMGCTGTLRQFDFLPNGDVIALANVLQGDGAPGVASDVLVLHPNALTKECEVVRNLTNLPSGSVAWAGSLSPDKTRFAYTVTDTSYDAGNGLDNGRLFIAAVDGTSPPAPVPGVPNSAGQEPFEGLTRLAPRWIAGGASLTLQIQQGVIDAGDGGTMPAVAVVSAGGGDIHAVAVSQVQFGHYVESIGGCNVSHGAGSALMAFGSLAGFIGLVLRRRRRDA